MTWYEMYYFKKPIYNKKYWISTLSKPGNPKTRSMNISIQGSLGTGKGVHVMHDFRLDLFTCYASITYSLNISFYVRPEKNTHVTYAKS
jgi:hypothetical protein